LTGAEYDRLPFEVERSVRMQEKRVNKKFMKFYNDREKSYPTVGALEDRGFENVL